MKILLTGASGFAGSHMLKYLMENTDDEVFCPVTFKHGGHQQRIAQLVPKEYSNRFHIFNFDLANGVLGDDYFLSNIELLINFASESHVDRSISNPLSFVINNHNLMVNLLEFVKQRTDPLLFVHISTDEVYGEIEKGESNIEWGRPMMPSNPYSGSKAAQEMLLQSFCKTYNLQSIIINSTNMIGEGQNQEKFLPQTIAKISRNEKIEVHTSQSGLLGSRKYVYVGDVANAIWIAVKSCPTKSKNNTNLITKFHVSGSKDLDNLKIVKLIADALKKEARFVYITSPRPAYDTRYELTSDKIKLLGWEESSDIEKVIQRIVHWYLENPHWFKIDHKSK